MLNLACGDKPIMVIGATSRPDSIDPGLRRAGRFDKEIGLGMPDEKSREKYTIFGVYEPNLKRILKPLFTWTEFWESCAETLRWNRRSTWNCSRD